MSAPSPTTTSIQNMALKEAEAAAAMDEVPVGALIVSQGKVVARAHNRCEREFHRAEMQAFTSASEYLGGKFLDKCTLYVTLEPCPMCAGRRLDPLAGWSTGPSEKRGHSKFDGELTMLHPKTGYQGGLLADEAAALLTAFFRARGDSRTLPALTLGHA